MQRASGFPQNHWHGMANINFKDDSTKVEGIPLDILAQLRKTEKTEEDFEFNQSTEIGDKSVLQKRARSKFMSVGLVLKLVQLDSPLKKSYWNTFHCSQTLVHNHTNNTITGKYCKNRWCLVCNRIRTAESVKKYLPVIESWNDKYLVTLTVPNCKGELLEDTIKGMERDFKRIQEVMRKRGQLMKGIRKLECTYNPMRNDFHPHYHILVEGQASAEEIQSQWLERNPLAREKAQDVRKADDKTIREVFKYFTKIICNPDAKGQRKVQVVALDVIFRAIAGKRTFQSFGFKLPKETKEQSEQSNEQAEEFATESLYMWEQEIRDWVDLESGEILSNYVPSDRFVEFVESISIEPIEIDELAMLKRPRKHPPLLLSHSIDVVLDSIME